jgi:hypothetical protein
MTRFVADVIGRISLSRRPPCPNRQVGEVAPAPRLDVIASMTIRSGDSKMIRGRSMKKRRRFARSSVQERSAKQSLEDTRDYRILSLAQSARCNRVNGVVGAR